MYNDPSTPSLITVLAGILSLILIITFFVIASRLRKIMEYLKSMSEISRAQSLRNGMTTVYCPSCQRTNYVFTDASRPILCQCGNDITENLEKKILANKKGTQVPA